MSKINLSETSQNLFDSSAEMLKSISYPNPVIHAGWAMLHAAEAIAIEIANLRESNEKLAKLHGNPYRG